MREFAFELRLCAALEAGVHSSELGCGPELEPGFGARQLGGSVAAPGGRILDILWVEPGPEFDDRVALTHAEIPDAAIESDVGTGRARYWKDAFDCHPDHARRATERAIEIDFFECERRGGRDYVRQTARYPDWFGKLVGIENKPDLGTPGDLEAQLRTDVSLGLVDEVILATESYVTRAHLHRIPDEVGVWRFDPDTGSLEVIREPTLLDTQAAGIELLAEHPGRTDVDVVSSTKKARARRRLTERAYGKGWRTYEFPACRACDPVEDGGATLPYCAWKGRVVDASSECGPSCGGFEVDESVGSEQENDGGDGNRDQDDLEFVLDPDSESAPDLETERDRRTPWVADPSGPRRQSGLDRFL